MYRSKHILKMNLFCTNLFLDYKQLSIISHLIQKKMENLNIKLKTIVK